MSNHYVATSRVYPKLDKQQLIKKLPHVGDILLKVPKYLMDIDVDKTHRHQPKLCRVVKVNQEKLLYWVKFDRTKGNPYECFKLPETKERMVVGHV